MYYICIEENKITSILNYSPEVPETVSVHEITDEQYESLKETTHVFDVDSKQVIVNPNYSPDAERIRQQNAQERHFLNSTDWMILRHLRQKHLGLSTTLTEQQFTELETQRHEAALRIIS